MGYYKDQLIDEQDAIECPECGTELEENDTNGGYTCPNANCGATYEHLCLKCGCPMSGDSTVCDDCFKAAVASDRS